MAQRPPRLTVGVPVRNGEAYLAQALESLLAQTLIDFVVLVGDNLSTDRTPEIVKDFAARDARVRYVRHDTNLGAAGNFSRLVRLADTELFRWHAADDLVLPEHTARCVAALDAEPAAVVAYTKTTLIDAEGRETGPYEDRVEALADSPRARFHVVYRHLSKCNVQYGVMRRDLLSRTLLMRPFVASDMAFLYELSLYGKFVEVPERLFLRRIHPAGTIGMNQAQLRLFYSPERWQRPSFQTWHTLATLERAICRAPLTPRDRALLQLDLIQEAVAPWSRRKLLREAREGAAYLWGRVRRRVTKADASTPGGAGGPAPAA